MNIDFDNDLIKLITTRMPYGKYTGVKLVDLPEPYVVWMCNNELPKGHLGDQFRLLYEIKVNGLEYLLKPIQEQIESSKNIFDHLK